MTTPTPEDPARAAWARQPAASSGVDLDRARGQRRKHESEARRRDRIAYVSAAIIAPSWAAVMWFMPDLGMVAALGFALAVWVPTQMYFRSGVRVTPAADGTCASFQQALLERELALCLSMPRWYLLPVALSQGAILFAMFTSPRFPQTATLFWGAAGMICTAAAVLAVARTRLVRRAADLRRELALLRAATGGDILATSKG